VEIGRKNHSDYKFIAKLLTLIGDAYLVQNRREEALDYFSKASELKYIKPSKAIEETHLGNMAFQKGDFPTALKHYTEAIKRNPDDPKLHSNRAACFAKLMEFRSALDDCEKCVKIEPTFIEGYLQKGVVLTALHESSLALKAFEEALRLDPVAVDVVQAATKAYDENPSKAKEKAIDDPEIQTILGDLMCLILEQMTQGPKTFGEHLQNPAIAEKISKLLEAGVIGMR